MTAAEILARSPLVRAVLEHLGITDEQEAEVFLNPDYETHSHAPDLMHDMGKAVARVFAAMEKGERIAVYSDFDCDGIPGAVVLHDFFRKVGYENFEVYIPHRDLEGYGLHINAIDTLKTHGVKLIITVDLGINAFEPVAHANTLGIDVIVTDHHEPDEKLPEAVAVVNPKLGEYPDKNLCGAATAYKLVLALLAEGKKRGLEKFVEIPEGWEKWLLDMVGLATVADMVPLVGENRVLARFGLLVLRKSPRPGLQALLRQARANQAQLTEEDIGFTIGPRINAASRMDEPELAFRLLATTDPKEGEQLARTLESLNRKRRSVVAAIVREAKKKAAERESISGVLVLGDPDWKPALLGLAANSVMGERGGIVCMWGRDGLGQLKGSCRSDGSASVVELFRAAADSLEHFGGHHASGGFSVSHEKVHTLSDQFAAASDTLKPLVSDAVDAFRVDMTLADASFERLRELAVLAPFGVANEKPHFVFREIIVTSVRRFGKAQEHLEISFADEYGNTATGISFFTAPDSFSIPLQSGAACTLVGALEKSSFGGRESIRVRIETIEPCGE